LSGSRSSRAGNSIATLKTVGKRKRANTKREEKERRERGYKKQGRLAVESSRTLARQTRHKKKKVNVEKWNKVKGPEDEAEGHKKCTNGRGEKIFRESRVYRLAEYARRKARDREIKEEWG